MARWWWLSSALIVSSLVACAGDDTGVLSTGQARRTTIGASDLAIVYPLPSASELGALCGVIDESSGEARLPRTSFARGELPELDWAEPLPLEASWASLRIVTARLDPCPGVVLPKRVPDVCAPELRLVFQSLVPDADGGVHARDGAIHAFYALSSDELRDALEAITAASPDPPEPTLGVHPRLASEGPNGPFAEMLRARLVSFARASRLFRVTHFRRAADEATGPTYVFRLRERREAAFFDENVPSTWTPEQTVRSAGTPTAGSPAISPTLTGEDDVTAVFRASDLDRASAFAATVRVLHPSIHSATSIDCASCHLAGPIARLAQSRFGLDPTLAPGAFVSPSVPAVANVAASPPADDLHLLSYRGRALGVGTRTRHEIAALLDFVNKRD